MKLIRKLAGGTLGTVGAIFGTAGKLLGNKKAKKAAAKKSARTNRLIGLCVAFCAGAACTGVVVHKINKAKKNKDKDADGEKKCACPVKKLLKKA